MKNDMRGIFIYDQIADAARESDPDNDKAFPLPDDDAKKMMDFALSLFDKLLPMLVSAVIAEYKKQVANGD